MKKSVVFTASLLLLSLFLTGCGGSQPAKTPQETIKDSIKKMADVSSYSFEVAANVDLDAPKAVQEKPNNVKLDLNFNGAVQVQDQKDPRLNVKLDLKEVEDQTTNRSGSLEARLNKDALYLILAQVQSSNPGELPKEMVDQYVGKWFKFDLPPTALKSFSEAFVQGKDANLTPEQKKIKDLYENVNVYTNPTLVGTESIKGESSFHYTVTIDKQAVLDFMKQSAEIQKSSLTDPENFKNIEDALNKFGVIDADIWIGSSTGFFRQVAVNLPFTGTENDPTGTVVLRVTLSDFNQAVNVEVPANTLPSPFNPFAMMGADTGTGTVSDGSEMVPADITKGEGSAVISPSVDQKVPSVTPTPAPKK